MERRLRALFTKGVDLQKRGQVERARRVYRDLLRAAPGFPDAEHLLGLCDYAEGRPEAALEHIGRALRRRPDDPAFNNSLGLVLRKMGRTHDAVRAFKRALQAAPGFAEANANLSRTLAQCGRVADAERLLRAAVAANPTHAGLQYQLAETLLARADEAAAADVLRGLIIRVPGEVRARLMLAGFSYWTVPGAEALRLLEEARATAPQERAVLDALAPRLMQANRVREAEAVARESLRLAPRGVPARLVLADVAVRRRDLTAASDWLQGLAADLSEPGERAEAHRLRARLAEARGALADAVAEQRAAHAALAETPQGQRARPEVFLDRLETYDAVLARWPEALPTAPAGSRPLVFLVGFPRSGTTLMERILAAHGSFAVAPELPVLTRLSDRAADLLGRPVELPRDLATLTAEECRLLADTYRAEMERLVAPPPGVALVDKMPFNMAELPLIARLFPDARVVMALRDPRDVVLSCFMNLFTANHAMAWMATPDGAAAAYDRVMRSWERARRTLPVAVHAYRYEDLVTAPRPTLEALLAFLGVPWSEAVLAHHAHGDGSVVTTPSAAAVAEPLTTRAVGRWQRYAGELGEVFARLRPWLERFGYERG